MFQRRGKKQNIERRGEISRAFQQMAGDIHPMTILSARFANRLLRKDTLSHAFIKNLNGQDGINLSDIWVEYGGQKLKIKGDTAAMSFDSRTNSIYGGIDLYQTNSSLFGVGFGYIEDNVSTNFSSYGGCDSYNLFAYGKKNINSFYLTGMLGYAYDDYNTKRNVYLSTGSYEATSDIDGYSLYLETEAGFKIPVYNGKRGNLELIPSVGVGFESMHRDSATESGDNIITLEQNNFSATTGQIRSGLALLNTTDVMKKPLSLSIGSYILYDFGDDRCAPMTNSLLGQEFEVRTPDPGQFTYELVASGDYKLRDNITMSVNATLDTNNNRLAKQVNCGFSVNW
jgi:uncharacterized protein with beta-barrel porin domain